MNEMENNMKNLTVGRITFSPNKTSPIDIASLPIEIVRPHIPVWLVVNAVRYALMSHRPKPLVKNTCDWIVENWNFLEEEARLYIKSAVNDAFGDYSRCKHLPNLKNYSPLGDKFDVKNWEKVRKLWKK